MTKHAESATPEETGRRLTNVDITPAMIEAGAQALRSSSRLYFDDPEIAENVFSAMIALANIPCDAG
jgi:hypothetical protein